MMLGLSLTPCAMRVAGIAGGGGGAAFSPSSVSGLAQWFDSTQGITTDGASTRVASWTARAGNAVASQSTTAQMPTVTTVNGRQSVLFDAADDQMNLANAATATDNLTLVLVINQPVNNAYRVVFTGSGANALDAIVYDDGTLAIRQSQVGAFAQSSAAVSSSTGPTLVVFTFNRTAATWAFRVNRAFSNSGGSQTTVNAWASPSNVLSTNGYALSGSLCEWLLYSRILSASEIMQVENYEAAKWGTP